MRDEHRDAICHSDGEADSLLGRYVSVGFITTEPTLPAAGVDEDTSAVNLTDRSEPASRFRQIVLHRRPPRHDFVDGISPGETEGSGVASRCESTNSPTVEVGDYLLRYFSHAIDGDRQRV